MPPCLVASVAPGSAARGLRCGTGKAKRLSAVGCKEFAIDQLPPCRIAPARPRAPPALANKVDRSAPYASVEPKPKSTSELTWDAEAGEAYMLCAECKLPVGEIGYTADGRRFLHGECQARLLLKDAAREEEARVKKDTALKQARRKQYDLGWKVERVPRNCASRLGYSAVAEGMCGISWDENTRTVRVVPTLDQTAALNLEYLALALQVQMREGKEPLFSLDPKDFSSVDKHHMWQTKRYEPAWLEGTSFGEVMFQADYHLKELSMGELDQPVLGMKSCFDFAGEELLEWNAREWFVVKKADIVMTEDDVLVPLVSMGVEARETFKGANGLEDVPLTRPNHPLVQYANAFTHNFDLIAERKSVINQLRELAKATLVSKFLVANEAKLDGSWLSLASSQQPATPKDVPQLWNEHRAGQIQVADGKIVRPESSFRTLGVYGGLALQMPAAARVRAPPPKAAAARIPTLTARVITARGAVPEYAVPGAAPKGVDLNLDKFDISSSPSKETPVGSWLGKDFIGNSFWSSMAQLAEEDRDLLSDVFKPRLSDRREEGDLFVPPNARATYVSSLRSLVEEERDVRKQRTEHFLGGEFDADKPGPLFPSSWTSALGIAEKDKQAALHTRPDYKADALELVKNEVPAFDKTTEDGTRYRIYRTGCLEVRTTQEHDGQEAAGAVFSSKASTRTSGEESWVAATDKVVKVTEHVERPQQGGLRHFYIVFETNHGDVIVTEKLSDNTVSWVENPLDLEYRNSQAKVIRSADCSGSNLQVQDAKRSYYSGHATSYSHDAFLRAVPARQKAWSALNEQELQSAEQLGIDTEQAWNEGTSEIWGLAWHDLGELRREAARALGYDKSVWPARSQRGIWAKAWSELSKKERQAAEVLGLQSWDASAWDKVRRETECIFEKSWVQLSEAEQRACKELGLGADSWDEAAWLPGAAWQECWAQLSEEERQAARSLGVAGPHTWDVAFCSSGKRGHGLGGTWEKSWGELSQEERRAAKLLGITGAGAWDNSGAEESAQRQWAQLSREAQEEKMALWVKQNFGAAAME